LLRSCQWPALRACKGALRQVLTRSVLAFGCAPRAACAPALALCPALRSVSPGDELSEAMATTNGAHMTTTHQINTTTGSESSNARARGKKAQIVRSHEDTMGKLLQENARRHRLHKVFSDFCEMSALALSNAVDLAQREAREARYMKIIADYERDEIERFPQILGVLVHWLESGLDDCLGKLFMGLDLGDSYKGQFFTPFEVSRLMAGITFAEARNVIEREGFVTVGEPACGAGGMVLAAADAIQAQGINYQQAMHVTAVDVDLTAVHMAYVQLSLAHIPAIVVHGNSLAMTEWSHWFTPAHIVGGWDFRLRRHRGTAKPAQVPLTPAAAPELERVRAVALVQRAERLQLDLF
jgi:hypothetical protein